MCTLDNNSPLISIVVPVYKVEQLLDKCVRSLLEQTYSNIEILLVDDGSPDRCPEMCEDYAKMDSRIRVIHKQNGGLSDARNIGIQNAKGLYILFVDSDDSITLDACEQFSVILTSQANVDIVVGNAKVIQNETISEIRHSTVFLYPITGEEYLKAELRANTMHAPAWLNLYRREFLLDNGLWFKVGLLHEDIQFMPRVFLKAKSVIGTDIFFYLYYIREGSITNFKDLTENAFHIINTCFELEQIIKDIKDKYLRKLLEDFLVSKYFHAINIGKLFDKRYRKYISKRFLVRNTSSLKNWIRVILLVINIQLYFRLYRAINRGR